MIQVDVVWPGSGPGPGYSGPRIDRGPGRGRRRSPGDRDDAIVDRSPSSWAWTGCHPRGRSPLGPATERDDSSLAAGVVSRRAEWDARGVRQDSLASGGVASPSRTTRYIAGRQAAPEELESSATRCWPPSGLPGEGRRLRD